MQLYTDPAILYRKIDKRDIWTISYVDDLLIISKEEYDTPLVKK